MINWKTYEKLRDEFGYTSSWTIWDVPGNGNWKSKDGIGDLKSFVNEEELIKELNPNFIFVGLNPAAHDSAAHPVKHWENFHSGDKKRSQDYKLRYALLGSEYWGSFITDIFTGIVDTNSSRTMKKATPSATIESINNILKIRELLGGTATVVAIGVKSYSILKSKLPQGIKLKKITHYAAFVNIDNYKEKVLSQLKQ